MAMARTSGNSKKIHSLRTYSLVGIYVFKQIGGGGGGTHHIKRFQPILGSVTERRFSRE